MRKIGEKEYMVVHEGLYGQKIVSKEPADDPSGIEAEPVQREKWIVIEDEEWAGGAYCKCSNCGYGFSMGAHFEPDEWNFCPNCGAKMDGDRTDE